MAQKHPASQKGAAPPPKDVRAALPRVDRHKPRGGAVRPSKRARWRAIILLAVHVLIGVHIVHWLVTGSSVTPVEPSEAMQTFEQGQINAGFILFALLIAGTLVFGRYFCGWACHVVALQDLCAWLLGKLRLRPRPVRSRLLVLAPFVVAGHMFLWPHIERWLWHDKPPMPAVADWQWHLQTDDFWVTFPGPLMAILTFLIVGFLIVCWLGAKSFCSYGCPYGAVFGVVDRFATGRIRVTDACEGCGHCTQTCTSNVRVHEEVAMHRMVVDPGCMKCMDCVNVCPKGALYYGFGSPKPLTISQQRVKARADFTWPEEIAMGLIALGSTQLVWRSAWFGEKVPFLMAVGLGIITAVFSMLGWRLLRKPNVTFQHTVLRQDRALTGAGRRAAVGLGVFCVLALHTSAVRFTEARAEHNLNVVSSAGGSDAQRAQALAQARRWLELQRDLTLIANPGVHQNLGLVYRELGTRALGDDERVAAGVWMDRAERELRRALELLPDFSQAALPLTDLLNVRRAWPEIEQILQGLLELRPTRLPPHMRAEVHLRLGQVHRNQGRLPQAEQQLRNALEIAPDWPRAALPLTDVLLEQDQWDEAEQILQKLLANEPSFAEAARRLELLRQRRRR